MVKQKKKPIKAAKPRVENSFREPVSLTCACNREITLAELGKTYAAQNKERLEKFLPYMNAAFVKYEINTCLKKAHFLAQVGHETGQLRLVSEQLEKGVEEKDVYDGYKGRGLIQITYKDGYEAYGTYVGQDFIGKNKIKLEEFEWATDSAGWYWAIKTTPSLNGFAEKNDLIYISQSINGGLNGYDDRLSILKRGVAALLVDQCANRNTCLNVGAFFLDQSGANDVPSAAFAWGLWHDKESTRHGTPKDEKESLSGYRRFLELKQGQKRGRYGFKKADAMIAHAEKRIKELSDEGK